ncbi:MAG: ribonuclease P protein component [Proteobacteria bacterium]|nr:ribonuclease P protein component [Pseudomonadota bacterium]
MTATTIVKTTLPREARLRSASDFSSLRHAPGRIETRYFLIRYGAGSTPQARVGLAISKRVSKSAVRRNRIKRIVRESFRLARDKAPRVDIVVIARTAAADAVNAALREDLDPAWARLKALKPARVPGTIAD